MCGIAGVVDLRAGLAPLEPSDIEAMVGALLHRGPDELGIYRDERAALGHTRLSIIDLATGQQPMSDETGTLWIVFNGEIFDFVEIRERLLALGHTFRTRSDTEVILAAYREWGVRCFERFDGQFALAIWDQRERRLVLARDRLGVRPLFLAEHGGRLWFASEVKAIFAGATDLPRAFDPVGLAETFTFWSSVPPQGVFRGISELEPGHARVVAADGVTDLAWWTPSYAVRSDLRSRSIADGVEELRSALQAAVRLRMLRADVPVGSYLSGGLDSSLIAALGRQVKEGRYCTFSIRFADAEFDETDYQRLMARAIGSEHREVVVTRQDIAEVFPDVVRHAERPLLRTAAAPMFLLSRLVRESGIKVVLTGEGADEMFAGYDLFREGRVRRFWGHRPESRLRPALLTRLYPYLRRSPVEQRAMAEAYFGVGRERWAEPGFGHRVRWDSASSLHRLFSADLRGQLAATDVEARLLATLPAEFHTWSHLARDQYLEVRTLLSGYLLSSQGDRMLMAHSVEGRFPFLDTHVVDLANAMPDQWKLMGLDEKHILKMLARDIIPTEIADRTKQPYRAPDARAFLGSAAPEWIQDVIDERAVADAGVFEPAAVTKLWKKITRSAADGRHSNSDDMAVVGVLSVGLLHRQMIRSEWPRVSLPAVRTRAGRSDQSTTHVTW